MAEISLARGGVAHSSFRTAMTKIDSFISDRDDTIYVTVESSGIYSFDPLAESCVMLLDLSEAINLRDKLSASISDAEKLMEDEK